MRRSLLKKSTEIHIELDDGAWHELQSTNAEISSNGVKVTLHLDLSKNYRVRDKLSHQYTDAIHLAENISRVKHIQVNAHGPVMDGLLHEMVKVCEVAGTPKPVVSLKLGVFGDHSFAVVPSSDETNLDLAVVNGTHTGPDRIKIS